MNCADSPLDTKAFAKRVGVHPKTVARWVQAGDIVPGRTPGGRYRFTEAHVALVLRGRASERALDLEAHVLASRAAMRARRGRRGA